MECRKTKTNNLPITQLGHFQTVVKPESMLLSDYLLHSIENHSKDKLADEF